MHIDTAIYLPKGWRDRLISWPLRSSEPADPRFLDPYDLAISKLGVAREKDVEFVAALISQDLLVLDVLQERVALLPDEHAEVRRRVTSFLRSCRHW
ncbi:DUF6036 family nucleotidyltransferase [Brachybacterium sacelli]|uniref:DUF6036 domain-containing protein n=1 Tax=Brachybacterium sacelli TaxID=173364 RepID=A0ABS4X3Y6_9MICO|nr:DUF6036 family nucleotidyltransferase [Brachybacterium sacelli]MBP2383086.1 hypothetical protein [Brachybacterium sacelli]